MYLVLYDDEMGICCPMAFDPECEGALATWSKGDEVALFESKKAALKAISISRKFAALRKAQGRVVNGDFTPECSEFIKVVACDTPEVVEASDAE